MRITVFHVPFFRPENDEQNPAAIVHNIPCAEKDWISVKDDNNGQYYQISTHYFKGGKCYQVAFRIEDPTPYKTEELSLHLDACIYRNSNVRGKNDLYYDRENNLWYQRTCYKKKSDGTFKPVLFLNGTSTDIDCITTAGVFGVVVMYQGKVLESYKLPWIYVLPSNITKDSYIEMLNDLLRLNEYLILDEQHVTGIGKDEPKYIESDYLNNDTRIINELIDKVKKIKQMPSELLKKDYVKTNIKNIKHFDQQVIRSYIKNGMSGKTIGSVYKENFDTYENRVIRFVLERLASKVDITADQNPIGSVANYGFDWSDICAYNKAQEERNKAYNDACKNYNSSKQKIRELLKDDWFSDITLMSDLQNVRKTAKFSYNHLYSEVYRLITQILEHHPRLCTSYDFNAFGVNSTQLIYEYWVFYKILERLKKLGFNLTGNYKKTLNDHFSDFINNTTPSKGFGGYVVYTEKVYDKDNSNSSKILIEVGYNCDFTYGKELHRRPDYYMRIDYGSRDDSKCNYYFFDAKYKSFSEKIDNNMPNYYQEIYDIAISKYINDMKVILPDKICGSYIIAAEIYEDTHDLPQNGRLFGGDNVIPSKIGLPREQCNGIMAETPRHRYGAIRLLPDNDQELITLFQMIFEYLETNADKKHPNLNYCWYCGSKINKEARSTKGGYTKYITTCPSCKQFRLDTHCAKCKKLIIKHLRNNYHLAKYYHLAKLRNYNNYYGGKNNNWMFICPQCKWGL